MSADNSKRFEYKGWNIFPDTIFSPAHVYSCNSSVTGECEKVSNVKECIDICQANPPCFDGYTVETPDGNLCVPIRRVNERRKEGLYHIIKDKNQYPILKNMKTYSFVSKFHPFPPNTPNVIFYMDQMILTSTPSGLNIGTDNLVKSANIVLTDRESIVQILPGEIQRSYITQHEPVCHGDEVVINIPKSTYALGVQNRTLEWEMGTSMVSDTNVFRIYSTNENYQAGDPLNYQDDIYFTRHEQPVVYDEQLKALTVSSKSVSNAKSAGGMVFKITPKVGVYFCGAKGCEKVSLESTKMSGENAFYEGFPVYRTSSCWGMCPKRKRDLTPFLMVGTIIVLCFLCFVFF